MNIQEIKHRNFVLRSYFEGRNWDLNSEYIIKQRLVLDSDRLLPQYPYVVEDEWEVTPDRSNEGKGDLVFTDASGCFAVIEVKHININSFGGNSSTKRTLKRKTVKEQAIIYAEHYIKLASNQQMCVKQVSAFIFTNELSLPKILKTIPIESLTRK